MTEASIPDLIQQRLQKRTNDISDATANLLAMQQAAAESFTEAEQPYVRTLDTNQPLETVCEVVQYLTSSQVPQIVSLT